MAADSGRSSFDRTTQHQFGKPAKIGDELRRRTLARVLPIEDVGRLWKAVSDRSFVAVPGDERAQVAPLRLLG
jgi:hypothetical protein